MKYLLLILLPLTLNASAQERLTLQEAIARTLSHNFDIRIADLAAQQAARNNTYGNAGFSPYVILNASATETRSNTHNDLASGAVQNNPHAKSTNYNPVVQVNWTIFDGGKMFLMKKELSELETIGGLQLKTQVQTMVSRTIQMYAKVVWQQKQLIAIDTALALAEVRMAISRLKYETGAGAKVDYLQAHVDYNARQSDSLTYVANLTQAMDSLSELMGDDEDKQYLLDDSIETNTSLTPIDRSRLKELNLSMSLLKHNSEVSQLNEKIAKTYFLPNLSFNGGYTYNRTTNSTGFSVFSQSYGPTGSLNLSVPVFEGGNLRRQAKVASLQTMRDKLMYDRQSTFLGKQYKTAWQNYSVAVAAYNLENESIRFAKENLDVQLARFRVGVGTTLESRQAETDYVTALERLYTASYNLKVNETLVLELENQLVK